jgi:hypothetical protein
LIFSEYEIDYFHYGYALIEALVLGKVVLLGKILHLGDQFHGKPLIVPTIYRTVSFSILVLAFAVVEHFVKGFIHGENIAAILADLAAKDGANIAARILMMFIAFIPMFASWEIVNLFGENKLFELLFERRGTAGTGLPNMTRAASLRQC